VESWKPNFLVVQSTGCFHSSGEIRGFAGQYVAVNNQNYKSMKLILIASKFLMILALASLAAGCASNTNLLDKENAATGAGFKTITPTKSGHLALLKKLPPDKVTRVLYGGRVYYVLPDLANNQAYVGGPKQFQTYQRFREDQQRNAKNYQAPSEPIEVVEANSMNWGEWGGWMAVGEPGWY
jgi:hypothetical protein